MTFSGFRGVYIYGSSILGLPDQSRGEKGVPDHPHQTDQREHDRRVAAILKRARRETGARDLLTFTLAKMWTALLAIGAVAYSLLSKWHRPAAEPNTVIRPSDT